MPDDLLREPVRTLGQIAVGEIVYARANALIVTVDRQVYLIPSRTEFSIEPEDFALRTHRDERGFRVVVRDKRSWVAAFDPALSDHWLEVASISKGTPEV